MGDPRNILIIPTMALSAVALHKERSYIKQNWKPILAIGGALSLILIGYAVYKRINPTKAIPGGLTEDTRFASSTLTDAQAKMKADILYKAMSTLGKPNANELQAIHLALNELSYNDFIKVSKQFGERRYVIATGVGGIWPADLRNLTFWLSQELPPAELAILNKTIPQVF